jgi:hypothetical protein
VSAPDWWCPLPLNCTETYGRLTIAGVATQGPGWCAHDLSPMYDSPEFRADNPLVETQAGRVARPTIADQTDYSLRVMFSGATDQDGTPHVDPAGGLLANRWEFVETFIDPILSGAASDLPAELVIPSASGGTITYLFDCQPLKLDGFVLLEGAYARGVLELRIPVPELAESGP